MLSYYLQKKQKQLLGGGYLVTGLIAMLLISNPHCQLLRSHAGYSYETWIFILHIFVNLIPCG